MGQDSGLFANQRLPQVQALLYVHDWNDTALENFGGEFVVYPKGPQYAPVAIPATPKSAVFCDGAEMVHGTSTFRPDVAPFAFGKDVDSSVRWDSEIGAWRLMIDGEATEEVFSWSEIRASIAYRGWCFADEDLMKEWEPTEWSGDWTLQYVTNVLFEHLAKTKKMDRAKLEEMDAYEAAMPLMETYIDLPKPALAKIPFNYCLLFAKVPALGGITSVVADLIC